MDGGHNKIIAIYFFCDIIKLDKYGKGLVAQWTRAHGYEPWCRGFESLLARFQKINKIILYGKFITSCRCYFW